MEADSQQLFTVGWESASRQAAAEHEKRNVASDPSQVLGLTLCSTITKDEVGFFWNHNNVDYSDIICMGINRVGMGIDRNQAHLRFDTRCPIGKNPSSKGKYIDGPVGGV